MNESKYLGRVYEGWKVVDRFVTRQYPTCEGTHATFRLEKKTPLSLYSMTVSDREIRLIDMGYKSIKDTVNGKKSPSIKNLHLDLANLMYKNGKVLN